MENELYHWGTKMHSGRYPYGSGDRPYQREGRIKKYHKKAKRNEKQDYKYMKSLSEDELWTRINRLNLEKKYKDAVNNDMYRAKSALSRALADTGKNVLKGISNGAGTYLVAELVKNKGDISKTDLKGFRDAMLLGAGLGALLGKKKDGGKK